MTHEMALGQQKTDEDVGGLLILPQLQAAIDALPADNLTFIVAKDGKPLTRRASATGSMTAALRQGLCRRFVMPLVVLRGSHHMASQEDGEAPRCTLDAGTSGSPPCWATRTRGK